jgi:hypothetical protein
MLPHPEKMKTHFGRVHPNEDGKLPHFAEVEQLLVYEPGLEIKNSGEEHIDAIRVDVEELFVSVIDKSKPMAKTPVYRPILGPAHRDDILLGERFKPGETAYVPIAKPLLISILQAQDITKDDQRDLEHSRSNAPHEPQEVTSLNVRTTTISFSFSSAGCLADSRKKPVNGTWNCRQSCESSGKGTQSGSNDPRNLSRSARVHPGHFIFPNSRTVAWVLNSSAAP